MSPRPLPGSETRDATALAAALELARQNAFAAAVASIRRTWRSGEPHPERASRAAAAFVQVARLADAAHEPVEALAAIDAALDAAPRWPDLHVQRARLLLARPGRELTSRTDARKALDTALRLHPDYAAARLERAMLDASEGRLGEALDELRELALQHPPGEAQAFERGLDSLRHADWIEAAALLTQALQLPGADDDPLAAARDWLAHDAPARALAVLRAALPGREAYPDVHLLIGTAELELGHHDDAVASFGRALALKPELHAARAQLARALEALGETAQAAEQIALVLERDPAHPEASAMQARWSQRGRRSDRVSQRRKAS